MDNNISSVYTAAEIADMRSTIDDIQKILQTSPFDEDIARQKVYEINAKHPDTKICSGKNFISKRKSLESLLMKCERIYRISERTYKKAFGKKQVDLSVGRDKHFVCDCCPTSF